MIKKSKQLQAEIRIAVGKLIEEEQTQVTLPKPFHGFTVQHGVHPEFPGEPLEFKDFGLDRDGHFYLIVTSL